MWTSSSNSEQSSQLSCHALAKFLDDQLGTKVAHHRLKSAVRGPPTVSGQIVHLVAKTEDPAVIRGNAAKEGGVEQ